MVNGFKSTLKYKVHVPKIWAYKIPSCPAGHFFIKSTLNYKVMGILRDLQALKKKFIRPSGWLFYHWPAR
jgi:hypothetical protein